MIVISIIFICDKCEKVKVVSEEVEIYTDVLTKPPHGWWYKNGEVFCEECKDE